MSTTRKISMTLAKASSEDFRIMWKVSKAHQNLAWADSVQRTRRLKMVIIGRLEQLGTGGFMRIVMGCEMLIDQVCDQKADHLELKPVYGAAPELLEVLRAVFPVPRKKMGLLDVAIDTELTCRVHTVIANAMGAPS